MKLTQKFIWEENCSDILGTSFQSMKIFLKLFFDGILTSSLVEKVSTKAFLEVMMKTVDLDSEVVFK